MPNGWDVVAKTPVDQQTGSTVDPQSTAGVSATKPVPRTVAAPIMGNRNPMMPNSSIKILVSQPPRPKDNETWRGLGPDEQAKYPGAIQISSRGQVRYPPQGVSSPGGAGPKKLSAQDQVFLNKMREEARQSYNMSGLVNEFTSINKNVETGGMMALPFAGEVSAPFSPPIARMKAIVDNITPAMRNGLPGAASDRDVAMFRGATVGLDKPYATNAAISNTVKAFAARQNDYVAFLEAYAKKNGSLLGAQELWNGYLESNPLFTDERDQHGLAKLNKVKPWRQAIPELKLDGAPVQNKPDPLGLRGK